MDLARIKERRKCRAGSHALSSSPLLQKVRACIRLRHYSPRTEKAYVHWIRRFILFHGKRHPMELGSDEVRAFLSDLAVNRRVSASTQNQALAGILFLYTHVLEKDLGWVTDVVRARRPEHLPVVLTRDEVARVLGFLEGTERLVGRLMYGSGVRVLAALARLAEQPAEGNQDSCPARRR